MQSNIEYFVFLCFHKTYNRGNMKIHYKIYSKKSNMFFYIFAFLFIAGQNQLFAQPDSLYSVNSVILEISTFNFQNSKDKVLEFIKTNEIKITNQKENRKSLIVNFIINQKQYNEFETLSQKLGYTISKDIISNNNYPMKDLVCY